MSVVDLRKLLESAVSHPDKAVGAALLSKYKAEIWRQLGSWPSKQPWK